MASLPRVIVGLGNPGPEYRETRHNLGHRVVEELAERLKARFRLQGPAHVAEAVWQDAPLYLAKLVSFMNVSGPPVARLLRLLDATPDQLVVVYDDLDLPFGTVRTRRRGRYGGHRGMESILTTLGTQEVRRVKIGVGRPASRDQVVDWVLTSFSDEERDALPGVIQRASDAALALSGAAA
ncbi:MAG TPA: aminoacyl-tRNA hydrolase [Methylomirabilota bacterium]